MIEKKHLGKKAVIVTEYDYFPIVYCIFGNSLIFLLFLILGTFSSYFKSFVIGEMAPFFLALYLLILCLGVFGTWVWSAKRRIKYVKTNGGKKEND